VCVCVCVCVCQRNEVFATCLLKTCQSNNHLLLTAVNNKRQTYVRHSHKICQVIADIWLK